MSSRKLLASTLPLLLAAVAFADFRYDETTRVTGGTMVEMMRMTGPLSREARQAAEPVTSTIMLKGSRMVRRNPDRTEIIDLDKETMTHIDHRRQEFSVTTFQQMKERIEQAQRRLQQRQSPDAPPQMNFKVEVRNTGATKTIAGLMAEQSILSMAIEAADKKSGQRGSLAFTNDMWMAPDVPGYGEVREFNRRLATKLGMMLTGAMAPSMAVLQPGSAEGMAEMVKEMSKLKGVPVMQIMRMGTTANGQPLPAASEAPLTEPQGRPAAQMPSAGDVAEKSAASAIAGRLGGLGGLGGLRRKREDAPTLEPAPTPATAAQPSAASSVLMETTTEMTGFSAGYVDPGRFNIPAGYKEVTGRN